MPPLEQKRLHLRYCKKGKFLCKRVTFCLCQCIFGIFEALKYAKNALAPGVCPRHHWGSSRRSFSPRPPSQLGRGTPVSMPHPLGAFGASILVPPANLELAAVLVMTRYPFLKMAATASQFYFQYQFSWLYCFGKVEIYLRTKFQQDNLNPQLIYYYFWFLKINVFHVGILLPVSIFMFASPSACVSASASQISSKSDLWCHIHFSRWRPSVILNYLWVTADHPRSANESLGSLLKFRLDRIYSSEILLLWYCYFCVTRFWLEIAYLLSCIHCACTAWRVNLLLCDTCSLSLCLYYCLICRINMHITVPVVGDCSGLPGSLLCQLPAQATLEQSLTGWSGRSTF